MKPILVFSFLALMFIVQKLYILDLLDTVWQFAPQVAEIAMFGSLFVYVIYQAAKMHLRFQSLEKEVKEIMPAVDKRFDEVDRRFDKMDAKFEAKFDKLEAKFDKLEAKFEKLNDKLDNKLDNLTMYLIEHKPEHLRKTK